MSSALALTRSAVRSSTRFSSSSCACRSASTVSSRPCSSFAIVSSFGRGGRESYRSQSGWLPKAAVWQKRPLNVGRNPEDERVHFSSCSLQLRRQTPSFSWYQAVMHRLLVTLLSAALVLSTGIALAATPDAPQVGSLGDLKLENGQVLRDCKVAYRTF